MLMYGAILCLLYCIILGDSTVSVSALEVVPCGGIAKKTENTLSPLPFKAAAPPPHNQDGEQRFFRDRPPMSYCLRIQSCSTLFTSPNVDRVQSRPFPVSGYNWTFIIKPSGFNDGNMWISTYVAIEPSSITKRDVYAELAFTLYSKTYNQYWTSLDPKAKRFNALRTEWGNDKFVRHVDFRAKNREYLFDNDQCVFGVDILVSQASEESEVLSIEKKPFTPFTWKITKYSSLDREYYESDEFTVGGRKWFLKLYPNGDLEETGKSLSLYVMLGKNEKLQPYEKLYVQAKLRALNQRQSGQYAEKQIISWFDTPGKGWGIRQLVSLADVRNPSKGYVVNDALALQVQLEALSSTQYYGGSRGDAQLLSSA